MSKVLATAKKASLKLETSFNFPFCDHGGTVECSIDLKHMLAEAACFNCLARYSTTAHALTEPIDVYSEWIDECELANAGDDDDRRKSRRRN